MNRPYVPLEKQRCHGGTGPICFFKGVGSICLGKAQCVSRYVQVSALAFDDHRTHLQTCGSVTRQPRGLYCSLMLYAFDKNVMKKLDGD